ncbi:MAG: hypothetical protein RIS94_2916 [Pseudomonadota bacterium]
MPSMPGSGTAVPPVEDEVVVVVPPVEVVVPPVLVEVDVVVPPVEVDEVEVHMAAPVASPQLQECVWVSVQACAGAARASEPSVAAARMAMRFMDGPLEINR